jgi:hypothetical protein
MVVSHEIDILPEVGGLTMGAAAASPEAFDLRGALRAELTAARSALRNDNPTFAVHQGRVRLKRIRALARLCMAKNRDAAKTLNSAARAAMTGLSDARDLAALEAVALELGVADIADALAAKREALGPAPLLEARKKLAAVSSAIAAMPDMSAEDLEAGVARLARRARKACAAARGDREPEARHTWRKREKDRLHALDVLGAAGPRSLRRRRRTGKRLARALGAERDVLLLIEMLRTDPALATVADRASLSLLDARRRALADRADRLGRAVHRDGA